MIEDTLPLLASEESFQDHLTGVGNRKYFEHELEQGLPAAIRFGANLTVLLLDLDRFKAVNDSLGHGAGDTLLKLVTARMAASLRPVHHLYRLGGDEFGIICGPEHNAHDLASRLVAVVQKTYLVDGCPVNIGVSIGLATAPMDGTNRADVMRRADLALYHAKASGRSSFVDFEPAMEVRAQQKRAMELDLRKAIALRQFELHYRPQIDVQTRTLHGLAAVLHWRHPVHGLLPFSTFGPLAEEIGLIPAVGEWMLKSVCREAARWPDTVTVAFGVSPLQFETMRFVEAVTKSLVDAKISGQQLEVEVTESILLRDGRAVLQVLDGLRSLGVRVAIDSFGTGIASLSQMVNFPLDKIKIDRSLIDEIGTGPKQRAIVRAIAAVGASLGIITLAEGVSTPEHLARIQMDGCTSVQGYMASDAVTVGELRGLVEGLLASYTSTEQSTEE